MKIIIAGNGAAAISAVEAIRERDKKCEITVLSKEGERAYTPCFLAQYVGGEIGKNKLYMRESNFYDVKRVDTIFNISVDEVRPSDNKIRLSDDSELEYDRLLLAAGSKPVVPPLPGIEGDDVFFFKTLTDADRIIFAAKKAEDVVVIGAGFIGLEIAEALSKTGCKVTVIEKEDRVLPRMLDGEIAGMVERHLRDNGLNIITGRAIKAIKRSSVKSKLEGVTLDSQKSISCNALIVSVGVSPNLEMIKDGSIKTNLGVMVDNRMRTNIPNIYAAGDLAEMEIHGISKLNPIHINAVKGGEIAGCNMAGGRKVFDSHLEDMNVLTLFGLPVLSLGMRKGSRVVNMDDSKGIVRLYIGEDEQVNGVQLTGDVSRGGMYLSLMRRNVSFTRAHEVLPPCFT